MTQTGSPSEWMTIDEVADYCSQRAGNSASTSGPDEAFGGANAKTNEVWDSVESPLAAMARSQDVSCNVKSNQDETPTSRLAAAGIAHRVSIYIFSRQEFSRLRRLRGRLLCAR